MIKQRKLSCLGLMITCLAIFGCDKITTTTPTNQNDSAKKESLQETESLQKQVENLQAEVFLLKYEVERLTSGKSLVSTEEKGYSIAQTKHGAFAISCKNVSQFLDGYKVKLSIGNLTSARFHGAKINLLWGKRYQNSKEVSVTNTFLPGRYTNVEVVMTPAQPEDIKRFTVAIEFDQISLM